MASSSHIQTKLIPRDSAVMQAVLKEMGASLYEPKVVHQMLEYVYRYITSVLEEGQVYSVYARKKTIDIDDIRLATKMLTEKSLTCVPPRELLLDLAKTKNAQPILPILKSSSGLRLPPDRHCLTQPNYQLQLYKEAIASSNSTPANTIVRLPGSSGGFKTPKGVPPRSTSSLATLEPFGYSPGVGTLQPTIQFAANVQLGGGGSGTPTITVLANPSHGTKRKLSDDDEFGIH